MKIDLNICGGFALTVDDNMDEDAIYELTQKIEGEVNAALSLLARKHNLRFSSIELQTED